MIELSINRPFLCRNLSLGYDSHKAIDSGVVAGVTWLDLDAIEQRYLLAACADGTATGTVEHKHVSCPCLLVSISVGTSKRREQQLATMHNVYMRKAE